MEDSELTRRLTESLYLISRVRDSLENASPKGYYEVKTLDYPIMMMYSRSRSLYEAINVLIQENLAEESIALARSLFEESLRLMHLASEGDLRWRYIVGWIRQSIQEKRSLVQDAKSDQARKLATERLRKLDKEERDLRDTMKRLGVVSEKRFTSTKNLAEIHGREEDLWPYEVSHRMVHGSQVAQSFRSSKAETEGSEDRYMLRVRSDEPLPKLVSIIFGTRSILFAHQSVASIFEFLPRISDASSHFDDIEALQEEP